MQRLDAARARAVAAGRERTASASPRRRAGLFGWVDTGVRHRAPGRSAMLDQGWLIAPGALFHAAHRPTTLMRINFATTQDARLLARACGAQALDICAALRPMRGRRSMIDRRRSGSPTPSDV